MVTPSSRCVIYIGIYYSAGNLSKGADIQILFGVFVIIWCMVFKAREVCGIHGRRLGKSKQATNGQDLKSSKQF